MIDNAEWKDDVRAAVSNAPPRLRERESLLTGRRHVTLMRSSLHNLPSTIDDESVADSRRKKVLLEQEYGIL